MIWPTMLKYQKMTEFFGCCLLGIDDDFGVEVSCWIMYIQYLTGVFRNSTFLWYLTLTLNLDKMVSNLFEYFYWLITCQISGTIRYMYIMNDHVYVMKMSPLLFAYNDTIIINVCMFVHAPRSITQSFLNEKNVLENV